MKIVLSKSNLILILLFLIILLLINLYKKKQQQYYNNYNNYNGGGLGKTFKKKFNKKNALNAAKKTYSTIDSKGDPSNIDLTNDNNVHKENNDDFYDYEKNDDGSIIYNPIIIGLVYSNIIDEEKNFYAAATPYTQSSSIGGEKLIQEDFINNFFY